MYEGKMPEAWRVMRIQAELVDGIEKLIKVGPAVTIFGSARSTENDASYQSARKLAGLFAKEGLAVTTGGGPGVMEAANRGAHEAGGESIGLNILLPHEQQANAYQTISLDFRYFFVRKFIFLKHAVGVVVYPGGFGTMDEMFEVLTLVQTRKVAAVPVVLVGKKFWSGLMSWVEQTMLEEFQCVSPEDLQLPVVVETAEEALSIVMDSYLKHPAAVGFEEAHTPI